MRGFVFLLVAMLAPMPAQAQEVIGTIIGEMQGSPAEWFITASDEGGQSDWTGDETYAVVTLVGHATPNTVLEIAGSLVLAFELVPAAEGAMVLGGDITYFRQVNRIYISEVGEAEISVAKAEFDDSGELHVSGDFRGILGASADAATPPNMTDNRTVSGSFDARLLILE